MNLDQHQAHKSDEAKAWYKKHRVIPVMLPASLTYRFQCVDVSLAAQMKALLYNHWCNFMAETIRARKYRETSWNYISFSKCDIIDWCMKSYKKLQTYIKICYKLDVTQPI